jgi:hypothetical protein
MLHVDVERLIPDDYSARAIWEFVGRLDLSPFYEKGKAVEGCAGQPPFDPRLMISVWVYGLSRGIGSARELSERCEWEPGLQWSSAVVAVNYHSLSTFREAQGEALKELLVNLLAVLSAQGLVSLERVTVEGDPHPCQLPRRQSAAGQGPGRSICRRSRRRSRPWRRQRKRRSAGGREADRKRRERQQQERVQAAEAQYEKRKEAARRTGSAEGTSKRVGAGRASDEAVGQSWLPAGRAAEIVENSGAFS